MGIIRIARFVHNGSALRRVGVFLVCTAGLAAEAQPQPEIQQRLRARIEAGFASDSLEIMDERIFARETLRRVYPLREFRPIWITAAGLSEHGREFLRWLETGPTRQGLRADHYHLQAIEALEDDGVGALIDLELGLSDAFLIVGSHFLAGRLNPETLDAEWIANRRHRDLAPVLAQAASGLDAGALLEALLPHSVAYRELVDYLAELRDVRDDGGWPVVGEGPTLRVGDTGARVDQLRDRLRSAGDLVADLSAPSSEGFDAALESAVRRFQARHGLGVDGLVGRATLEALNVPIQQRINQIIVNLERWRWLPETLGEKYVLVNIAGFRLDVIDQGRSILTMRVVVGRPYRRTPVFSDNIRYLVLNPSWEVPATIGRQDKLPLIKQNPAYLENEGYQLLQGWGADERLVDPASVDWSTVTSRNFPYRLKQLPGPSNALGRIKFMFPNDFSVYLHDTPARNLFGEDSRAFSSGCIRLEAPLDLAEVLLLRGSEWNRAAIERAMAQGREQTVILPSPVPVHLQYWTAWVESGGGLNFREDIYARDVPVLRELREDPPL